jgi:hypothetical protein
VYGAFRLSVGFVVYSAVNIDKVRECHRYIIHIMTVFANNCHSKISMLLSD